MRYYMGLDVGGTKTYCLIADEKATVKGFGKAATGNYEYKGLEHAARENEKAVQAALADASLTLANITAIGMGVAGADLPEDFEMLEQRIYTPLFADTPRIFRNDSFAGLRGGTRQRHGIVIACGTGCVCAGRNGHGDENRVGGLGEEFGDECTGAGLGMSGLRAVWQARDNIIPPTALTEKFLAKAGLEDVNMLFQKIYHREISYDDLQPMAKIVFEAAVDGDPKACDILLQGGAYLGAMVIAVAKHLEMTRTDFEVVRTGSVFQGASPLLGESMAKTIHAVAPQATIVPPKFEPVVGAMLMAMDLDVDTDDHFYDTLETQLLNAETKYRVRLRAQ